MPFDTTAMKSKLHTQKANLISLKNHDSAISIASRIRREALNHNIVAAEPPELSAADLKEIAATVSSSQETISDLVGSISVVFVLVDELQGSLLAWTPATNDELSSPSVRGSDNDSSEEDEEDLPEAIREKLNGELDAFVMHSGTFLTSFQSHATTVQAALILMDMTATLGKAIAEVDRLAALVEDKGVRQTVTRSPRSSSPFWQPGLDASIASSALNAPATAEAKQTPASPRKLS